MKIIGLILLAVLFASCASVPRASKEHDLKAKTFEVVPDKAVVYIYRNEYFGAALTKMVSLDDKVIGATGAKTYIRVETTQGKHRINSNNEDVLEMHMVNGKIYFIRQEIKMGFVTGGSKLIIMDPGAGRLGVMESTLVGMQ